MRDSEIDDIPLPAQLNFLRAIAHHGWGSGAIGSFTNEEKRYVAATDACVLVAVESELFVPELPKRMIQLTLEKFRKPDRFVRLSELKTFVDQVVPPRAKTADCATCMRTGSVLCQDCRGKGCDDCGMNGSFACDACESVGQAQVEPMNLGPRSLNAGLFALFLPHVFADHVGLSIGAVDEPVCIHGDGWFALVMPYTQERPLAPAFDLENATVQRSA